MPYVDRTGNRWICWNCIGENNCGECANRQFLTVPEMTLCLCTHPAPSWLKSSKNTGPIPIVTGDDRAYTGGWNE